jgi:dTDP-4-dehydrorhamnose 3,5-epimerase
MLIEQTAIPGVVIVRPQVFTDDRGVFFESFNAEKFAALGLPTVFNQDNVSISKKGVLRGLHFQRAPKAMGKLVRCSKGKIWDVAVDIRPDSPTFKKYVAVELTDENRAMLFVPAGFAHGFYALTECEVVYKATETFSKEHDANVAWNDSDLAIAWPFEGVPLLSDRDKLAPNLASIL